MKTLFEKSFEGRRTVTLPALDVPEYKLINERSSLDLPAIAEVDLVRHYSELSRRAYGVDNGFYPLGSCTMKYNPKVNEEIASLEGFNGVHPLQPANTAQGALKVMYELTEALEEISGMDAVTLQPAAGAHGEYTGLMLVREYFLRRGETGRTKVIVPDSAHGTNPASATACGFEVINIPSRADKTVDTDKLRAACGPDTAALMLTNPNTLGMFEKNIGEIVEIVHSAGGLVYYDGANLNAIMGIVRPGDMGFDVMHFNLHKTFSTPHGGGGPGSGPVGCKAALAPYLPNPVIIKEGNLYSFKDNAESIGKVKSFYGNFNVCLKALAYIKTLGREGLKRASEIAVLNANYMMHALSDVIPNDYIDPCMHEFVISYQQLKDDTTVTSLDMAKALIDNNIHPPTIYFPLIVHEAAMFEPTETESKETIDGAVEVIKSLYKQAYAEPSAIKASPKKAVISRPDDVKAARTPVLIYRK